MYNRRIVTTPLIPVRKQNENCHGKLLAGRACVSASGLEVVKKAQNEVIEVLFSNSFLSFPEKICLIFLIV
jgi:hypothetical protein